jgi:hypothetical protein
VSIARERRENQLAFHIRHAVPHDARIGRGCQGDAVTLERIDRQIESARSRKCARCRSHAQNEAVRLHLSLAGGDRDKPAAGANRTVHVCAEQPFDIALPSQAERKPRTERRAISDLFGGREDAACEFADVELERRLQRQAFGRRQHLLAVLASLSGDRASRGVEFPPAAEYHKLAGGSQPERKHQALGKPRQFAPAQGGERELRCNGLAHRRRPAGEQESRAPADQGRIEAGADTHRRIRRQQQRWQLLEGCRRRQRCHERVRELAAIGGAGVFRGGSVPVDDDDVVPGLGEAPCGRQSDDAGAQYTDLHFGSLALSDRPIGTREPIGRRVVACQG